jgi:hypothetical protein
VLHDRLEGAALLIHVDGLLGRAQDHHRTVVHRVVEGGAGEDQGVDQRDLDADRRALAERGQHPAGHRAVDVEAVGDAGVQGRDHERVPLVHEADVADETLVEDRVDEGGVVAAPLGQPLMGGARGREHGPSLGPTWYVKKSQFEEID